MTPTLRTYVERSVPPCAMAVLCLFVTAVGFGEPPRAPGGAIHLNAQTFADEGLIELAETGWKYHPGDDASWAAPPLDDARWETLTTSVITPRALPRSGWRGTGWFRLWLRVEPSIANRPMTLVINHWGEADIYLNGALLQRLDVVASRLGYDLNLGRPVTMTLPVGTHLLAIRQSSDALTDLAHGSDRWLATVTRTYAGFKAILFPPDAFSLALDARAYYRAWRFSPAMFLLGAFGMLHLLLFTAYRSQRANLFIGLYALALSILLVFELSTEHPSLWDQALLSLGIAATLVIALPAFLSFLYATVGWPRPWFLPWLATILALLAVLWLIRPDSGTPALMMLLYALGLAYFLLSALRARVPGVAIIAFGVLSSAVFPLRDAVTLFGIALPEPLRTNVFWLSVLGVMIFSALILARQFGRINRDLEAQLVQVQELSRREIEHERRLAAIQVQQEHERAEHERRTRELEEARRLQLSMLPRVIPSPPHLDIAAHMTTATEVGGDYYDFHVGDDHTLTIVLGDATGHGLRAGTMVTAVKALLTQAAGDPDIASVLGDSSRVLKAMNLPSLYMALTLAKLNGSRVRVGVAGMPPTLVYRAGSRAVEPLVVSAVPLGTFPSFPYEVHELDLSPGDALLLMSDGFPERFNADGDMLGYDRAPQVLADVGDRSAQTIVDHFVETAQRWADGRPLDDDMTFVAVKRTS